MAQLLVDTPYHAPPLAIGLSVFPLVSLPESKRPAHHNQSHSSTTVSASRIRLPLVRSIGNGFAAEVIGADLGGGNLSEELFKYINDALLEHKVLVIRDQQALTVNEQRQFTAKFGK
jgi:Taurine catabolism dioxygenase TauD, TfdA family